MTDFAAFADIDTVDNFLHFYYCSSYCNNWQNTRWGWNSTEPCLEIVGDSFVAAVVVVVAAVAVDDDVDIPHLPNSVDYSTELWATAGVESVVESVVVLVG